MLAGVKLKYLPETVQYRLDIATTKGCIVICKASAVHRLLLACTTEQFRAVIEETVELTQFMGFFVIHITLC